MSWLCEFQVFRYEIVAAWNANQSQKIRTNRMVTVIPISVSIMNSHRWAFWPGGEREVQDPGARDPLARQEEH